MAEEKVFPEWKRPEPKVVAPVPTTGDTVMVALNRPIGISFTMPDNRTVVLAGNGQPLRGQPQGILPVGEYGLTMVRKDDWDYILANFGKMKIFTEGLCFATKKESDTIQEAESRADLRNGLEPIDPENDPSLTGLDDKEGKPKRGRRKK